MKLLLELNSLTIKVVTVDERKINVIGNNDLKIREDSPPYLASDYWMTTGFPRANGFPKQNSWFFEDPFLSKKQDFYTPFE